MPRSGYFFFLFRVPSFRLLFSLSLSISLFFHPSSLCFSSPFLFQSARLKLLNERRFYFQKQILQTTCSFPLPSPLNVNSSLLRDFVKSMRRISSPFLLSLIRERWTNKYISPIASRRDDEIKGIPFSWPNC